MSAEKDVQVSVIIATYNYGTFIQQALRSVEVQTKREWECLVIDDASTDDTASIVRMFVDRDPRFRYIRLPANAGVSVARNRGFKEAKGKFIQLLDADDIIAPRKLEVQSGFLSNAPDVAVVYSDFIRFTGEADLSRKGELAADEKISGKGDRIVARLLRGNVFRLNTVLYRRSLLDELGGFRDEFRYVEDWDFWMRIAVTGHVFHYLDDPTINSGVRVAHQSLSRDLPAMRKFHLPVRQHLWVHGGLSLLNRVSLLLHYCDFLLEMLLVRREPVIFLKEGRALFIPSVTMTSLLLLPFWLISRPFRSR